MRPAVAVPGLHRAAAVAVVGSNGLINISNNLQITDVKLTGL